MSGPFDADAYLDVAAAAVGIEVADDYREGVKRFLLVAADMAAILEQVDLDDRELALAPVYTPPETGK
jgi:hypothetical protein